MAASWIKVRVSALRAHPKIVRIVSALRSDKLRVIGALCAVWEVFDQHSIDGRLEGYSFDAMDSEIGWPGFSDAMHGIGWLDRDGDCGLIMPRFSTHNGKSAKRRDTESERKRAARAGGAQDGRKTSASNADKKRRPLKEEEKNTSSPSEKKARKPRRTPLEPMPAEFAAPGFVENDPEIVGWSESKGFPVGHLPLHREYFQLAIDKTDLQYAGMKGWRAAFKKAVSEDWAGIRTKRGQSKTDAQVRWLDALTGGRNQQPEGGNVIEGTSERRD